MLDYTEILQSILISNNNSEKWKGSLFEKIKTINNSKVGSVGQDFIEKVCNILKITINFPLDGKGKRKAQNPWDIKINDITFELKTATEDTNNNFQFNHIRYHREYQAVICLGIAPNNIYFNMWSKADTVTEKAGNLASMEKGANASYKLTKSKEQLFEINKFYEKINGFVVGFNEQV